MKIPLPYTNTIFVIEVHTTSEEMTELLIGAGIGLIMVLVGTEIL